MLLNPIALFTLTSILTNSLELFLIQKNVVGMTMAVWLVGQDLKATVG